MPVSEDKGITLEEADFLAYKIMQTVRKHAEAGNKEAHMILVEAVTEACKENKTLRNKFPH